MPLLLHAAVEAASARGQELADDVGVADADRQLVARYSRLGDGQRRRAHGEAVPDEDGVFAHALGRKVLAEHAGRHIEVRELLPPVVVVLGWIHVDGLARPAVD